MAHVTHKSMCVSSKQVLPQIHTKRAGDRRGLLCCVITSNHMRACHNFPECLVGMELLTYRVQFGPIIDVCTSYQRVFKFHLLMQLSFLGMVKSHIVREGRRIQQVISCLFREQAYASTCSTRVSSLFVHSSQQINEVWYSRKGTRSMATTGQPFSQSIGIV